MANHVGEAARETGARARALIVPPDVAALSLTPLGHEYKSLTFTSTNCTPMHIASSCSASLKIPSILVSLTRWPSGERPIHISSRIPCEKGCLPRARVAAQQSGRARIAGAARATGGGGAMAHATNSILLKSMARSSSEVTRAPFAPTVAIRPSRLTSSCLACMCSACAVHVQCMCSACAKRTPVVARHQ